jgi:cytochrome c5
MKISLLLSALALTAVLALYGQESHGFPDGEGKELVTNTCAGCHELDRVAAHTGDQEDWGGVVYSMRQRGLELTPEDTERIVAYLAKSFPPPAKKAVAPLPDGDGKDLVMNHCAGCHDLDRVETHTGTKDEWERVVKYMASLGLAAKPEENARIVAYLAKNFPPPAKEGAEGKAPVKPATPAPTQPR